MRIIRSGNMADLQAWYDRAICDPTVWPWISTTDFAEIDPGPPDCYNAYRLLSDGGECHVKLSVSTGHPGRETAVSFWCLDVDNRPQIVGAVWRRLVQRFLPAIGVHRIISVVAVANEASMRATSAALGEFWGIEPDGFNRLGRVCGLAHFASSVSAAQVRLARREGVTG